jgi:hypothetical protein
MISIHTELVVGGAVTGGFIGFFWHPVVALAAAMLVVALVAVGDRKLVGGEEGDDLGAGGRHDDLFLDPRG